MYAFTSDTFSAHIPTWDTFFDMIKPAHVLEIGPWEGRSTIYSIEKIHKHRGVGSVICVDTWQVGNETAVVSPAEQRFLDNIQTARKKHTSVDVQVMKGQTIYRLADLIARGFTFDLVHINGNRPATDILSDLVLVYNLVRVDGIIICGDYLSTSRTGNPLMDTKIAVDAFTNIFYNKIGVLRAPLGQLYLHKVA